MRTLHRGALLLVIAAGLFLLSGLSTMRALSQDIGEANCHDVRRLFVDGATLVRAKFVVELVATEVDWPEVVRLMEDLAQQRNWSFRNTSISRPGVVETLELSVCAPDKPVISVNKQSWASRDSLRESAGIPSFPERDAILNFMLHGNVTEAVWQPVAADLVAMLEARWPDRVGFIDENSSPTDRRPDFLFPKP